MTTQDKSGFYADLEDIFRKNNRMNRIVSIFMLLFFGGGFLYMLSSEHRLEMVGLMCLLFMMASIFWLFKSFRDANMERNKAYQAVRKENGNLIWIYAENKTTNGATSYNVTVMDKSGKTYTIPTGKFVVQGEVIDQLAELYPDAYFGYDPETKQAVKQLLKK